MATTVRGIDLLQEQLKKAREHLKDVDENIKKITGRSPDDFSRPGQRRISIGRGGDDTGDRGRGRLFNVSRRGIPDDAPSAKRRAVGNAFSRLGPRPGGGGRGRGRNRRDSGDEDEMRGKPVLPSVVQASDSRSRRETIDQQNKDTKGNARNRRMFGLLLGTLQRFKDDSQEKQDRDKRRRDIELKLEERAVQEREDVKKERQMLFNARKRKQQELRQLETKMELVKLQKDWERETKKLSNFIRTKTRPHIYYLPKELIPSTIRKQQDTRKFIDELVTKRRKKLEEEIEALVRVREEEHGTEEEEEGEYEEEEEDRKEEDKERGKRKRHHDDQSRDDQEHHDDDEGHPDDQDHHHDEGHHDDQERFHDDQVRMEEDKENDNSNDRVKSPRARQDSGCKEEGEGGREVEGVGEEKIEEDALEVAPVPTEVREERVREAEVSVIHSPQMHQIRPREEPRGAPMAINEPMESEDFYGQEQIPEDLDRRAMMHEVSESVED
ncbi:pinin-like [Lineus longissimus]|uniref:pinin-like n=1 Tax=Lineus longissimus TaxID=88925 RepID=UPI002B4F4595